MFKRSAAIQCGPIPEANAGSYNPSRLGAHGRSLMERGFKLGGFSRAVCCSSIHGFLIEHQLCEVFPSFLGDTSLIKVVKNAAMSVSRLIEEHLFPPPT